MDDLLAKAYLFVISLPFVIAGWITKRIIANDQRIAVLERMLVAMNREFEIRDKQRSEDREMLREMRDDIKDLMEGK